MILHHRCIGCDISKAAIDIFDPASGAQRLSNDAETCRSLAASLAGSSALVVLEATGAYDRARPWPRPAWRMRASTRSGPGASPRPQA